MDGPNRQYFVAKVLLYAYYIKVTNVDAFTNAEQLSQVGQLNGMPGDPPPGGANVILIKTILEHNFTLHKYDFDNWKLRRSFFCILLHLTFWDSFEYKKWTHLIKHLRLIEIIVHLSK